MNEFFENYEQLDYPYPNRDLLLALSESSAASQNSDSFPLEECLVAFGITGLFSTQFSNSNPIIASAPWKPFRGTGDLFNSPPGDRHYEGESVQKSIAAVALRYCREQRAALAYRGTFDELSTQHLLLDPSLLPNSSLGRDSALLWTYATSLRLRRELLVPADWAYTDLNHEYTKTEPCLEPEGYSNGAGVTYADALTQAITNIANHFGLVKEQTSNNLGERCQRLLDGLQAHQVSDLLLINLSRFGVPLKAVAIAPLPAKL